MNFKLKILLFLFIFQTIIVSCDEYDCGCGTTGKYEREYNEVSVTSWDTSKFTEQIVKDDAYKNAFGIKIKLNWKQKKISILKNEKNIFNFKNLGFSKAYACSCPRPEFIDKDPLQFIKVYYTDQATSKEIEATELFGSKYYTDKVLSVSELIAKKREWFTSLDLDLVKYKNIPEKVKFRVEITLKSGKTIEANSKIINFK